MYNVILCIADAIANWEEGETATKEHIHCYVYVYTLRTN